jgi:REP element-mobilizing transposase RayT
LKGRDYAAPGIYFVTICTDEKRCTLAQISEGSVELSSLGEIVRESWIAIPSYFAHVNLHEFAIMPNHVHGIIEIGCQAGAQRAAPLQEAGLKPRMERGSLGVIVRAFKAVVTRRARTELSWRGQVWQRNYFERVVRDGQEFSDTCRYIKENPMNWDLDSENPEAKSNRTSGQAGAQRVAPLQGGRG